MKTEATLEIFEHYFTLAIEYLIIFVEIVGVTVLLVALIKAIIGLFKKNEGIKLELMEGLTLALEFKIGGELLRTVIVRTWEEIILLGAVILLRAALAFLIQWEIRLEKKRHEEERIKTKEENNQ